MNTTKISVILPVYNSEKTIGRAIDSIIDQTVSDWELLIVYDDSEDKTLQIVKRYCEKDARIKLIMKNTRQGIAAALNVGLKKAQGRYIARMDADDVSYRHRFEKQLELMQNNPNVMICGTAFRIITDCGYKIKTVYGNNDCIRALLLLECPIAHPTVMFRADLFDKGDFYYNESIFVEDYELWFRASSEVQMANVEEVLLDYYMGQENTSVNSLKKVIDKTIEVKRIYLNKYLGLNTQNLTDELIGLDTHLKYLPDNGNTLIQIFKYLSAIEKKNDEVLFYEKKSLNEILAKMWNRGVDCAFLWNADFLADIPDLHIDKRLIKKNWKDPLFDQLCVDDEDNAVEKIKNICNSMNCTINEADRVIVYGLGFMCDKYLGDFGQKLNIVAYADGNKTKQGKFRDGKIIIAPSKIQNYEYDYILIASKDYYIEIKKYLIFELNISKNIIFPIDYIKYCRD